LRDGDFSTVEVHYDETARWLVIRRGRIVIICNLSDEAQRIPVDRGPNHAQTQILLASAEPTARPDGDLGVPARAAVVGLV
jgi:maltooligosyltrehalose trehalohydrolase